MSAQHTTAPGLSDGPVAHNGNNLGASYRPAAPAPESLARRLLFAVLILTAVAAAAALRLPRLGERPLHGDEAVQAFKTLDLAQTGVYRYDPVEYHGPSLYYLSLLSVRMASDGDPLECDKRAFRIVPVIFGIGVVLLMLLMADGLGRGAAVCAALLTAFSPAMVFYSRFYIQEMLLVFFTFAAIAAGWRYVQACPGGRSRRVVWAVVAGAALGLMHATKETCIIAYAAMLGALAVTWLSGRIERRNAGAAFSWRGALPPTGRVGLLAGLAAACAVSFVLYSSFFTNPAGVLDSVRAYAGYLDKAGSNTVHLHPWYFYLKLLFYVKYAPGPWWSEALILALAVAGLVVIFAKSSGLEGHAPLLRFIAVYTLLMTLAYSLIPYKTPWCMLGFLHGMILLAGVGAAAILKAMPNRPTQVCAGLFLVACLYNLAQQTCRANFIYYADNRNPYVYAHPVTDVLHLVARVEEIARALPEGRNILIKVIAHDDDYWPLPWYLREFSRVGYWNKVPDDLGKDAAVVIVSARIQPEVESRLHDAYRTSCYGLRPHVHLWLYVRNDAWDAFMKGRAPDVGRSPAKSP